MVNDSNVEFIDDETNVQDQGPSDYRLMNVTRGLQEAMQDQSMVQELDLVSSDPVNFVSDYVDEVEHDFDEFTGVEERIQKFKQYLKIFKEDSKNSFYFAIFYAVDYSLLEEKVNFDFCQDNEKLAEVLGRDFFDKPEAKKESLHNWT